MIERILNWVVGLSLFSLLVFAMIKTEEKQSEFKAKCDAIGGVVVSGFRIEKYCTKGTRFNDE